jgi:hypothetical protein
MVRLLEILLAAGLYALLLSPLVALIAGAVVVLTGLAFIPVFAPLTTALAVTVFAWIALREAKRRKR